MEGVDGAASSASVYLRRRDPPHTGRNWANAIHFEAPLVPVSLIRSGPSIDNWSGTAIGGWSIRDGFPTRPEYAPLRLTMTPTELTERLGNGTWACIWMGDHRLQREGRQYRLALLLVLEWKEGAIATRVGALVVRKDGQAADFWRARAWSGSKYDCFEFEFRLSEHAHRGAISIISLSCRCCKCPVQPHASPSPTPLRFASPHPPAAALVQSHKSSL